MWKSRGGWGQGVGSDRVGVVGVAGVVEFKGVWGGRIGCGGVKGVWGW